MSDNTIYCLILLGMAATHSCLTEQIIAALNNAWPEISQCVREAAQAAPTHWEATTSCTKKHREDHKMAEGIRSIFKIKHPMQSRPQS